MKFRDQVASRLWTTIGIDFCPPYNKSRFFCWSLFLPLRLVRIYMYFDKREVQVQKYKTANAGFGLLLRPKNSLNLLSSCSLFCIWCISFLTCKTLHSPIGLNKSIRKRTDSFLTAFGTKVISISLFSLVLTRSSLKNQKRVHKSFPFLLGGLEIVSFIVVENLLSFSNVPRA